MYRKIEKELNKWSELLESRKQDLEVREKQFRKDVGIFNEILNSTSKEDFGHIMNRSPYTRTLSSK